MAEINVRREKLYKLIFFCFILLYSACLLYLYYNQLFYEKTGLFESDTFVHVKFAVEEHYFHSLAAFIYLFLHLFPFGNILIAVTLTVVTVGSIFATVLLVKLVTGKIGLSVNSGTIYLISVFANLLSAFYISFIGKKHYIGYECANMWHNSTYLFMRLFAIITVILYIKAYDKYKDGLSFKDWLFLTLFLGITTGFKASFLTVFAPMLAIILLSDLCKSVKFIRVFAFGTTVLPSVAIMVLQSIVMSEGSKGGGYAIAPFEALKLRGEHPKAALILSILYPLVVLLFHGLSALKTKLFRANFYMFLVAFLEVFLLIETGERSLDSNFLWGYSIALFFLFLMSMLISLKAFINRKNKMLGLALFSFETLIGLWHVISGIWYFCLLLTGVTYFV